MNALINTTNKVSSGLQKEMISLLKQKIEDSVIKEMSVVIIVFNSLMEIRNKIFIDNIEFNFNEDYFSIFDKNFELHIKLNRAEITYDDIFDTFTIIDKTYNNINIELEF